MEYEISGTILKLDTPNTMSATIYEHKEVSKLNFPMKIPILDGDTGARNDRVYIGEATLFLHKDKITYKGVIEKPLDIFCMCPSISSYKEKKDDTYLCKDIEFEFLFPSKGHAQKNIRKNKFTKQAWKKALE